MTDILQQGPDSTEDAARAFTELVATIRRLRAPDGCPWDRAQTHDSLKAACVEEAAEVVCGINILSETGKSDNLREELGDLLLQVLMHALIAEEEGLFTLTDVLHTIDEKMIRRHPHVFPPASGERDREGTAARSESPTAYRSRIGAQESITEGRSRTKAQKSIAEDWNRIKAKEKEGREWEEACLFDAFAEAEALIEVARRRKFP